MTAPGIVATATGGLVNPFTMTAADIRFLDIIRALSNICRWGGACTPFYSVAEHSVWVQREAVKAVAAWASPADVRLLRAYALLHDASEAYIADIAKPVKPWILGYGQVELNLMLAISLAFEFEWPIEECVHEADMRLQSTEARDLMGGIKFEGLPEPYEFKIVPWSPVQARARFMARFLELTGGKEFEVFNVKYE
jgi:5'-deoxynucleotidase YfbR-like HD superfamily hydrolase